MEIKKFFESNITKAVAVGTVGAFALGACGESAEVLPNRPGTVVQHLYDDPDSWLSFVGRVPITRRDPAHYYLEVQQCDRREDEFADEQGCVSVEVEVNKETYETYPDGSTITFEEE